MKFGKRENGPDNINETFIIEMEVLQDLEYSMIKGFHVETSIGRDGGWFTFDKSSVVCNE